MNLSFSVVPATGDSLPLAQDDYFGLCPFTETMDGYVNVGREHFGYSKAGNTYWHIGSNLFSSWHRETDEDWDRNRAMLAGMRVVEPVRLPADVPRARPIDTGLRRPWDR